MKSSLKRANVALLTAVVLVGTAACAPATTEERAGESSPVASATPEACTVEDQESLGDAVVMGPVEDEFGVYCALTASPELKSKYISYEDSNVTESFSEEDFNAAQDAAAKFFIESLDSPILDMPKDEAAYAEWLKDSELSERWQKDSEEQYAEAEVGGGLAFTNFFANPLPRTGEPRLTNVDAKMIKSGISQFEGKDYVYFTGVITTVFEDTDENVVATIMRHADLSLEDVKKDYPKLFDGKEDGFYEIAFKAGVAYLPENGEAGKMNGFHRYYKATAADGPVFYEDEEFADN